MAKEGITGKVARRFSGSVLKDACGKVRNHPRGFFVTMGIDALFLLSLIAANKVLGIFLPNPGRAVMAATERIGLILALLLLYAGFIVIVYSLFKYQVLSRISQMFGGKKADPSLFGSFLRCNFASLGIFAGLFALLSAVFILSVKVDIIATVRDIFFSVFAAIFYLWGNTAHSLFALGTHRVGEMIGKASDFVFGRFRLYLGIIGFTIAAFAVLAAAYLLLDWALVSLLGNAITIPLVYYTYAAINTAVIFILLSGLIAFNRVYFYDILKRYVYRP
jgi:hypothetical protein